MDKKQTQLFIWTLVTSSVLIIINIILLVVIFSEKPKEESSTSVVRNTANPTNDESSENSEVPNLENIDELPPLPELSQSQVRFITGEVTEKNRNQISVKDLEGNSVQVQATGSTTYSTAFTNDIPSPNFDAIQSGYFVTVECETAEGNCTAISVQITPVFQDED